MVIHGELQKLREELLQERQCIEQMKKEQDKKMRDIMADHEREILEREKKNQEQLDKLKSDRKAEMDKIESDQRLDKLPSKQQPVSPPELLAVDVDMVECVKSAMRFCDDLPSILNNTLDVYKAVADSATVSSVKMKLKIHLKDLRLFRLTPEKLHSLREGLELWDEQNKRTAARLRSRIMESWSTRHAIIFGVPWEYDWAGLHDFQVAFQGIATGLELVMNSVR